MSEEKMTTITLDEYKELRKDMNYVLIIKYSPMHPPENMNCIIHTTSSESIDT